MGTIIRLGWLGDVMVHEIMGKKFGRKLEF